MSRKKQAAKQSSKKATKSKAARGNEISGKPITSSDEASLSQQHPCREGDDPTPADSRLAGEQPGEHMSPLAVEWRPRAELDRESIAIFLGLECGNPQAALSAIRHIDAAIERIRLLPDSGGRVRFEQLARKEYRTVLANPYTIYYRFDARAVTIYRVLHQRRNMDDYALVDFPE